MPSAAAVGSASPDYVGKGESNTTNTPAETTTHVSPSRSRSRSDSSSIRRTEKSSEALSEKPPVYQPSSIKISKEIARLQELVAESSPEAVQAVLRDNVDKFLIQDDQQNLIPVSEHLPFVLRAGMTWASDEAKSTILSAHQSKNVRAASLAEATSFDIQESVPVSILDPILRDRLKTVSAMQVIRWLAEANRLGYSAEDIIENDDESIVVPKLPDRLQDEDDDDDDIEMIDAPPKQTARPLMITPLSCRKCKARFDNSSGYSYHTSKNLCDKKPPFGGYKSECDNCHQGFTSSGGKNYHDLNKCCRNTVAGATPIANSTSPSTQLQQEAQAPPVRPAAPHALPYYPSQMNANTMTHPQQPMRTNLPTYPPAPTPMHSHTALKFQPPQTTSHAPPYNTQLPAPRHFYTPQQNNRASMLQSSVPRFASETPSHSGGTRKQNYASSPEVRMTPESLPPEEYAKLNVELDAVDNKYESDVAAIDADPSMSSTIKEARKTSLKNGQASKKSQIRKKFGVTLRLRDKDKKAMKAKGLTPTYNRTGSANGAASSHYLDPKYSSAVMNSSPLVNSTLAANVETPQPRSQLAAVSTPPSYQSPQSQLPPPPQPQPTPVRQSSGFTPLNRPGQIAASLSSRSVSSENSNKRRRSSESSPAARNQTPAEPIELSSGDEDKGGNGGEEHAGVGADAASRRGGMKAIRGGRREFNIPRPAASKPETREEETR
ncbi:hypothetical protein PVAG01_01369 [Phlyctema vagabunda]|uniref:C2H2-type domain-containing protein n=1 Tax=Phlyctema vagabunda TaxID=108571 RepID=A0ABR4PWW8_9HELO